MSGAKATYLVAGSAGLPPFTSFTVADGQPSAFHRRGIIARVIRPLLAELKSRRALRRKGQFFVLTGPGTFSAGVDAALDLRELGGVLVGGPTGGKPNCYGESPTFRLPNTGLHVSYCIKYFKPIRIFDPLSLQPAVPVSESYRQWASGLDPVLEWVLKQWK